LIGVHHNASVIDETIEVFKSTKELGGKGSN